MLEHFFAVENVVFLIALLLLGALFILELLSLLSGLEMFSFMDVLLPDTDLEGPELGIEGGGGLIQAMVAGLNLGRVPFIFSLITFLFLFSCIGYNLQLMLDSVGIGRLPMLVATPIAFVAALPFLRWANAGLARIIPKTETSIIEEKDLIGRIGVITIGIMTHERQCEVRVKDHLERDHYVQAVCDSAGDTFRQGDHVLLVGRRGYLFTVIPVTNPYLEESSPSK